MSIWAHVIGNIRYDGIAGLDPEPDVGIACTSEDNDEQWDKCNIPCGDKGSLTISKWTNPSDSCLARWTITVFGSLRNYPDGQPIIDYFDRIVKGQSVRQGCFSFQIGEDTRTFVYMEETNDFRELVEIGGI